MALIHLTTKIKAPIQVVFDLSRSIDFHQKSVSETGERAISGRITGLIELGEAVTWEAVHFGVKQNLTTKITAMNSPHSFTDEMVQGVFKSIKHEHLFSEINGITTMVDNFHFESPFGLLGKLFNAAVLTNYMTSFLKKRNAAIKKAAEGELK